MLRAIAARLEEPALNVVLHSTPYAEADDAVYHWHLEIVPRVLRASGFDLGSGTAINPVSPEEAARVLRAVRPDSGPSLPASSAPLLHCADVPGRE